MKITLTGSLGNITKPLATTLIDAGHEVHIISSNADKATLIAEMGAIPEIGSVTDTTFLSDTFSGSDALYLMIPTDFSATNLRKSIGDVGKHYADAIKASGVKNVVLLSSVGAHLDGGTGPIAGLHDAEETLKQLPDVNFKFLRPGYFYLNFLENIEMVKHMGIIGSNHDAETVMVLVHPQDIAKVAAEALQEPFKSNSIRYIVGDERRAGDVAGVLGAAIGKPELPWIEFTDEQAYEGMVQAGLPPEIARNYVEMGASFRNGVISEDYEEHKSALEKTKLEDFAIEFAEKYGI